MPTLAPLTTHSRLLDAMSHVLGDQVDPRAADDLRRIPLTDPVALSAALTALLPGPFSLTGPLDRRLLLAERASGRGWWTAADLSGHPHASRSWPAWTAGRITVGNTSEWLSTAHVTREAVDRLLRPRVLLTALYHPEWFPLPRFPLAISDLARAARSTLLGQVRLMDMQLGVTIENILTAVDTWQPDIVGISATFGQHDLMTSLLEELLSLPAPPLVLAGGSLTARNEQLLLDRHPQLLVARGAGEPTLADIMSYVHEDLDLSQVRGLGYVGAARGGGLAIGRDHRRTAAVTNRAQSDFLPELDLLDATFEHKGVAQLEASRGCTNSCSFCPRGHKGSWAGSSADALGWILKEMGRVFDRHPGVSRTLYLVDEEVIGAGPDAVPRVLDLATTLHAAGFQWESSCRVNQVVDPEHDRTWHVERARMWRQLVAHGLRRMLFGVESGVASVLVRFNKETTATQNALAIRTLSALGVPTRFIYITFDPLMDLGELRATHAFQARTDLLLRPLPHLSVEDIVDGVHDDRFVARHSTGQPLHTAISYLLVSMECLLGAAYTRRVQAAGLARAVRPSMGRVDAEFADWRIGRCSHHAQLWVDRHFALDYTLKSLEKILDETERHLVRTTRVIVKGAAFALLTDMLDLLARMPSRSLPSRDVEHLDRALRTALDHQHARLTDAMANTINTLLTQLPADASALLHREHRRWEQAQDWQLINAADPCGT
nr:radical SAM protein [Parafrankia discariae]